MHEIIKKFESCELSKSLEKGDLFYGSRKEYKFIIPLVLLGDFLNFLKQDFYCKVSNGDYQFYYKNTYYDTAKNDFFHMHRKGKYNRLKLRIRRYKNGLPDQFIECKEKVRGTQSKKRRIRLNYLRSELSSSESGFIDPILKRYHFKYSDLTPSAEVDYCRIHLLAKKYDCRLTIDMNLRARSANGPQQSFLSSYFLLEVKSSNYPKDLIQFLRREFGIREVSFSKYCVSMCLLNESLPRNKWKSIFKNYIYA